MKHIRYARHNTSTLTCGCTQDKTGLLGESLDVSHPSALPKLLHMLTLPLCFCHLTSSFVPVTITTTTRGSRHWAGLHVDLPLFENDPSLRCCSDSLFCAVTALWLMTHHLMCLNLLVVLWCLCWFWMCGPPPRTWLDPLAALHLLLPVWHPVHPDWSGTRSWPSNPEETIWGTGNDKCLASSTVRAADVFSLPARRCASRCYARLLCQLVFIPCELALRHSSDYLGTGPGLFLNTPIIFATTIRWSKS